MVAPVTGPFNRTYELPGPAISGGFRPTWYYRAQSWYRQRKPYDQALPYGLDVAQVNFVVGNVDVTQIGRAVDNGPVLPNFEQHDAVRNKCYAKLVDKLNNGSLWAVNLLEMSTTVGNVAERARQLTRFTNLVKKLRFVDAARSLRMSAPPKGVSKKKRWQDNWLEYHFGWEPLVNDIGAGIEVLSERPDPTRVVKVSKQSTLTVVSGSPSTISIFDKIETRCKMQARVRITNPNLHLAQQLGFVNPLSVAWEAVPFSFVVDWFTNVGQVLGSMTDFAGTEMESSFTTVFQTANRLEQGKMNYDKPPFYQIGSAGYTSVYLRRSNGIPSPVLRMTPWKGFSPARGATAVALLLQTLKK
jgi:hypothetical protein